MTNSTSPDGEPDSKSEKKATFTIMSMMKDEGHCLIEWVAYHNHIGFDNICVYTNNCNDGTDAMLMRLEELGYCKHFRNDVPEGKKPQPNALSLAEKNPAVMNSEWILTMDADEFVSVKAGRGKITDLLEALPEDTDAVAITWRFFGSSELTDWNPGMVIESYRNAAPDKFRKGWGVKTLFKPFDDMKLGIHRPHMKKAKQIPERAQEMLKQKWVNGSGEPMPTDFNLSGWRSTKPTLGYKLVELNHYGVKSYEAYLLRRIRGNVNNKAGKYDAAYFALFDRNEKEATNALRHARGTRRLMDKMLEDDQLRGLYEGALEYHKGRVDMLRTTGEYDQWLTELKEASQVPIDRLDEILFTQHLPKIWQEKVREMQEAGVPPKEIAKLINASQTAKKAETREAMRAAAEGRAVESEKKTSAESAEEFVLSDEMKAVIAQKIREGHAEMARAKGKAPPTLVPVGGDASTKTDRPGAKAKTPSEAGATPSPQRRVKLKLKQDPAGKVGSEG
ncbi:glycosyltransferase family 2 protein [Oceanicola sp. 502str15]|uniref:glycosyltransferase family 2 protein n=1 Tax=Oceanicola sp. 502str15 TaxID=2696061 RepID=UPI0020960DC3|nr:glycosyltransferase family 2 protein [Oceanicola sp. 502str15]